MLAADNFLATVSHELCTPLNGIIGLSYALQASQEVQLKAELSKTLTVITMSGKRLLQLIYDVLDAAKTAEDSPLVKRESVNVRALVLDVAMLCSSIVRQGVDLRVQLQPVPRIIGDTGRIVQVRAHRTAAARCMLCSAWHGLGGVVPEAGGPCVLRDTPWRPLHLSPPRLCAICERCRCSAYAVCCTCCVCCA